jgi:3-oxoacyl-[acyl-carrier protein] reductase
MELGLSGKVAVLIGPAKGMGPAITAAFAREGCRLVLAGRDITALAQLAQDSVFSEVEKEVVPCDITNSRDTDALAQSAISAFGRIDILVNIAGGTGPIGKRSWETTQDEMEQILQLNITGSFNTMRAVLPSMIHRKYGKIVNVGGTFGMRGRAGRMAYSASKWGLRGLTKSTALEAGPFNINVNCVAPGMVDGPRFREKVLPAYAKMNGVSEEDAYAAHARDYALARISEASDVANACLFLSSDVSRQITGIDLPVDGGWALL